MKPKSYCRVMSKNATKKSMRAQEDCVYCSIGTAAFDHSKNASPHGPSGIADTDKKQYELFRRKYRYRRKNYLKTITIRLKNNL